MLNCLIMGESRPPVFTLSWDEWEHPKRAIAAIWVSTLMYSILVVSLIPTFGTGVQLVIGGGVAIILGFVVPLLAAAVAARFD